MRQKCEKSGYNRGETGNLHSPLCGDECRTPDSIAEISFLLSSGEIFLHTVIKEKKMTKIHLDFDNDLEIVRATLQFSSLYNLFCLAKFNGFSVKINMSNVRK